MKVLLLGQNGYLGSYLYEHLNVDILPNRKIEFTGKEYDYIINCIGYANINFCELNVDLTNYSNRDIISDIKNTFPKSKIINFSSYYVYNDNGLCSEIANTTDYYHYTKQKLQAEKMVENGVTYRLGKLFGHKSVSKQNKLTEHIIMNNNISVDNVYFNPTSLSQVLSVIKYELNNQKFFGIYNLSNDGAATHYEYAMFINNLMGRKKTITLLDSMYPNFFNYGKFLMSCEKIKQYINLIDWKVDLTNYIKNL